MKRAASSLWVLALVGCGSAPLDVIRERPAETPPAEPPRFAAPVLIDALALPGADDDPTFTANRLELYFSSSRGGNEDIWRSTRSSADEPWGAPSPVHELNTEFLDATPGIAPDGLTIWFESTREAAGNDLGLTDIWVSQRATTLHAWSEPVLVEELSTEERDSAPMPSSSLLLSFSARRDGGLGDTDIYATLRTSAGSPWGPARLVPEASSTAWDQGLFRADGNQLFISSGRDAAQSGGNLFWSARGSLDGVFQEPSVIADLSSDADEQDLWVADDLGYAVFASDRDGDLDLYEVWAQP